MIFVSGQHGSGKTTLSKSHVLESNGFVSVDSGPLLREQHFVGVGEERLVSTARLKQLDCENPNMVGQTVVRGISRMARAGVLDEAQEIIVVGIRSMRSVRYITNNIKFGRRDMLVYLEAPPEMLLQRYNARERSRLHMGEFMAMLREDFQNELEEMKNMAHYRLAANAEAKEVALSFRQILRANGYSLA